MDYTVTIEVQVTAESAQQAAQFAIDDLRDSKLGPWNTIVSMSDSQQVIQSSGSPATGKAKEQTSPRPPKLPMNIVEKLTDAERHAKLGDEVNGEISGHTKIGTQRNAESPLQELEYRGEIVALPGPKLSVGSVVAPKAAPAALNSSYWLNKIRAQIEADTLAVVNKLRREYPERVIDMGKVGDPLPAFNAAQVDAKMAIVLAPDSVEIAGHAPCAMHAVGTIGNHATLKMGSATAG